MKLLTSTPLPASMHHTINHSLLLSFSPTFEPLQTFPKEIKEVRKALKPQTEKIALPTPRKNKKKRQKEARTYKIKHNYDVRDLIQDSCG